MFVERLFEDKDTDKNVDADHDRTVRPVVCSKPVGLSSTQRSTRWTLTSEYLDCHSVVKQAENSRVRELVKKIENHPHRQDLQADLQQNNAHNPFSEKSKKMIKDMGNVELFDSCETLPSVQGKECMCFVNLNSNMIELKKSVSR